LDAAEVESTMLAPSQPMRDVDKFVSLDMGTILVGGILANRRTEYTQGEVLAAQCTFNPPHEDMWIECNLHDAQGRIVHRMGEAVPREELRHNFYYDLTGSYEPGVYFLVMQNAGKEIFRRQFTLLPQRGQAKAPLAN
jgi:hypothetical protein